MKRFVTGVDRSQTTVFPERLEDFIAEDNPAPAIDAFTVALDLRALGVKGVDRAITGPYCSNSTITAISTVSNRAGASNDSASAKSS